MPEVRRFPNFEKVGLESATAAFPSRLPYHARRSYLGGLSSLSAGTSGIRHHADLRVPAVR